MPVIAYQITVVYVCSYLFIRNWHCSVPHRWPVVKWTRKNVRKLLTVTIGVIRRKYCDYSALSLEEVHKLNEGKLGINNEYMNFI